MKEVDEYKGLSIPPLPDAVTSISSIVKHDDTFLKERRTNLNNFLRLITAHPKIRLDELLCKFLTQTEFEDASIDPYLYGKVKRMMRNLPNTHGMRLDMDFVNTFMTFTFAKEDDQLRPLQTLVDQDGREIQEMVSFV